MGKMKIPAAVMLTIAELARRDGVSKQAVSAHVKRLAERQGLVVHRDGLGHVTKVNAAQYDALRRRHDDPSKAQAPPTAPGLLALGDSRPPPMIADGETYEEALRLKTFYDAELKRLDLEAAQGRSHDVASTLAAVGRATDLALQAIDGLPAAADEVAQAVSREGVRGARAKLKALGAELRATIADAFAAEARRLREMGRSPAQEP